ncbi:MAG TPA: amidohydrolase [Nocardioidaceae bacterium]
MSSDPVMFTGGPIRLMDGAADSEPPEALLLEAGVVRAVGRAGDVRATARSTPQEVDLDGRTLFPGFVDAHAHTLLHGCGVDWVDLSDAKTIDDVVERLRRRAEERPGGSVHGYGYDQSKLAERRHPSARDLDEVTQERQVWIQHASGHGYVVNSPALDAAGITAATSTPVGGRIDRDADGRPTGVVFDAACDLLTGPDGVKVSNHGPNFHLPMTDDEVARLFDLGQQSFLAAGITTICDAQVTELEMRAYLLARDDDRLRIRAHLLALSSRLDQLRSLGLVSTLGDERLQLHGVKFYADGSVIARTAYLGGHSCCGKPEPTGYLYHDPAELTELITTAHDLGLRTATHAQGDIPIGIVLDAVEQARDRDRRPGLVHRIEHCGFPTPEQIARMSGLGVVPVPQPMQVHLYGDSLIEEYGDWGGSFYPYGSFEKHGLPVVVSSDAPVTMPAPLQAAWAAVTRTTASGAVAGGVEQGASRTAAIEGTTVTPARLLGRSDVGTLGVGSRADLVLLDSDPIDGSIDSLRMAQVTETWVGGDVAWSQARAS